MDDLRYLPQEQLEVLAWMPNTRLLPVKRSFRDAIVRPIPGKSPGGNPHGAAAIVVAHNHPSGLPEPSHNDPMMRFECGQLMGLTTWLRDWCAQLF